MKEVDKEKLGYVQLNDWTPPENQERFIYGYLEADLWKGELDSIDEFLDGDLDEFLEEHRICINCDIYDMSIEYWVVGPWKFFEEKFPELLEYLSDTPEDNLYKGDSKAFPTWTPENYGINWIDSDEVIFGPSHEEEVTDYVIVSRSYTIGKGWSEWQKPDGWIDKSLRFNTLKEAEKALKKEKRYESDTYDSKIVPWTHKIKVYEGLQEKKI